MPLFIRVLALPFVLTIPLVAGCGDEAATSTSKSELQQYMEEHPELAVESAEVPDDLYGGISNAEIEGEEVE
ncbi:hypothetical protein [Neorhodopirellula lusitana]|uniref:hypothetical protein n=1 Tax=Neorhodopirellula lusitana TaxID=445327 RepID=UPI00385143B0